MSQILPNEPAQLRSLLATIQASTSTAIVVIDKKYRILFFNCGAEKLFGYSVAKVLGESFTTCIAPQDRMTFKNQLATMRDTVDASPLLLNHWRIEGIHRTGDHFSLECTPSCHTIAGKLRYILVLQNMTEHNRVTNDQKALIDELRALHQVTKEIASELALDRVFQRVVETAQRLVKVRYAALGIRNEQGMITRFVTAGINVSQREKIGPQPVGRGLLSVVFQRGESMIVDKIAHHPAATGFPAHHPIMEQLLSVPIFSKGQLLGALYLADKNDKCAFSQHDLALVEMLALHAAIAIDNAQLYSRSQQLSALEERARFAQDLHDSVIQSLYAEGMMLDQIKLNIDPTNEDAHQQLDLSLEMLARVIQDIRSYIFDLRPQAMQQQGVRARLEGLVQELRVNIRLPVQAVIDPAIDTYLEPLQAKHVFHICHEALSNAARHAKAEQIVLRLMREANAVTISVKDDGVGFTPPSQIEPGHRGLANIQERAVQLGAQFTLESHQQRGTHIQVTFQLQ